MPNISASQNGGEGGQAAGLSDPITTITKPHKCQLFKVISKHMDIPVSSFVPILQSAGIEP